MPWGLLRSLRERGYHAWCWLNLSVDADRLGSMTLVLTSNTTLKFFGATAAPATHSEREGKSEEGFWMWKAWRMEEKKRKNCRSANLSPKHILWPTPKGMKASGLTTLDPPSVRNLSGLKISGSGKISGFMWTAHSSGITCAFLGSSYPSNFKALQKKMNAFY